MVKKLQNVREAHLLAEKMMEKLNDKVKQSSIGEEEELKSENFEIKYLEEVILADPSIKYIDI